MQVWWRKIIGIKFENLLKLVVAHVWSCVLCFLWQWWWGLMFVFVIWNNNSDWFAIWSNCGEVFCFCNLKQQCKVLWFCNVELHVCPILCCLNFVLTYGRNVCVWRFLERESWERGCLVLGYGRIGYLTPSVKCWS
jgi:hypothetical protein